jgi:hypothetical protein
MSSFTLCRVCIHFNPVNKTCVKSVGHERAVTVRLDPKKCGIKAKWFETTPMVDYVLDLLDVVKLNK